MADSFSSSPFQRILRTFITRTLYTMYFKYCNHRTVKREPKQEKCESCILATLQLDSSCLPTKTEHCCSTCFNYITVSWTTGTSFYSKQTTCEKQTRIYIHMLVHTYVNTDFPGLKISAGPTVRVAQKHYRRKPSSGKASGYSVCPIILKM